MVIIEKQWVMALYMGITIGGCAVGLTIKRIVETKIKFSSEWRRRLCLLLIFISVFTMSSIFTYLFPLLSLLIKKISVLSMVLSVSFGISAGVNFYLFISIFEKIHEETVEKDIKQFVSVLLGVLFTTWGLLILLS